MAGIERIDSTLEDENLTFEPRWVFDRLANPCPVALSTRIAGFAVLENIPEYAIGSGAAFDLDVHTSTLADLPIPARHCHTTHRVGFQVRNLSSGIGTYMRGAGIWNSGVTQSSTGPRAKTTQPMMPVG